MDIKVKMCTFSYEDTSTKAIMLLQVSRRNVLELPVTKEDRNNASFGYLGDFHEHINIITIMVIVVIVIIGIIIFTIMAECNSKWF